mmetsp:Transcript_2577/g.2883  ORF Transcript_2577/g.2883 Transcript_2577/m.2883 type:complete len:1561 (-) Transcript_2577:84-4766(-)
MAEHLTTNSGPKQQSTQSEAATSTTTPIQSRDQHPPSIPASHPSRNDRIHPPQHQRNHHQQSQAPTSTSTPPLQQQQQQQQRANRQSPPPSLPRTRSGSKDRSGGMSNVTNAGRNDGGGADEAARAALTMAAVAQAASANNKSPAEAAEIAKAHAQNISKKQHSQQQQRHNQQRQQPQQQQHPSHRRGPGQQAPSPTGRPEPRKIQPVPLESVKSLLRSEIAANSVEKDEQRNDKNSRLLEKLADGENDSLLQQLLLMEYLKAGEDDSGISGTTTENSQEINVDIRSGADCDKDDLKTNSSSSQDDVKTENWKTTFACERVKFLLRQVEMAYDTMEGMLPVIENVEDVSVSNSGDGYDFEDDLTDTPTIVPDFLPPCTTKRGDNTLDFFRACSGESSIEGDGLDEESSADTNDLRHDSGDVAASVLGGNQGQEGETNEETKSDSSEIATASSTINNSNATSSIFSNMFGLRRPSLRNKSFLSSFTKRNKKGGKIDDGSGNTDTVIESEFSSDYQCEPGEYTVIIEREMLGLTVENVLERTVVRTVLAAGPAKKAGAKVGSLIVKVGNIETKNLTHFETIDELRQSQRPLQLVLRQIPDGALRSAREEMGRLIRGSGFGRIIDGEGGPSFPGNTTSAPEMGTIVNDGQQQQQKVSIKSINTYSGLIRKRWIEAVNLTPRSKKCEPILRVGEKLIWIMTLFVVGLEREAERLFVLDKKKNSQSISSPRHSLYNHSAQDYADAAKSASKVLFDFVKNRMDPSRIPPPLPPSHAGIAGRGPRGGPMGGRAGRGRGRVGRGMPMPSTVSTQTSLMASISSDKLLLQIGDVLQRMRTFLADPTSPPAAMLRGELIACLCDILDADTEMKLSEEENFSDTQGGNAGPIADLGAAGSLLKLIVLNCPIMRSPECEQISAEERNIDKDEMRRRCSERKEEYSSIDYHRLHAGNRFLAVVHRLAASRSTSARITACSLGPVLWSRLDFPHQLQLRGVITRALHDVEVIVRKSTATVLHEIAELVYDSRCVPWLVLMCERAMTDPEPQLRSAAMTLTWHLAEHLPNAFLGDASKGSRYLRRLPSREDPIFADVYLLQCKLLPVATRLAEDRAPHVRLAVAAQCERLCDALGDHWSSVIIDVLVALLTDSDERVRGEAVLCVPRLADIVLLSSPPGVVPAGESSVLDALLPAAVRLQKDPCSSVRVALATAAGELLTLLVGLQRAGEQPLKEHASMGGRISIRYEKRHVDERLIPLVQRLLQDQDPEVTSSALRAVTNASRGSTKDVRPRFDTEDDDTLSITSMQSQTTSSSVEKKDPVFLPVLSEEQVLRLLPTLLELANSKQWRVRQSAVEIVPALLGCTDKFETRAEIARLCIRLTNDKVDAVRKTAAECLCLGGTGLGSHGNDASGEWITALVIPQMQSCAKNTDYRQRLLCLKMVEVILINNVCPTKWKDESANAEGKNTPLRELLKLTLSLADDRIANVRLNVGLVLGTVTHVFRDDECRVIKYALLQQLKKEKTMEGRRDRDVNYYATKCLERIRLKVHGGDDDTSSDANHFESSSEAENDRQMI